MLPVAIKTKIFPYIQKLHKILYMLKKFTPADLLMLTAAFLSLIFSEISWFKGDREAAIFIGLWVPSILGFAILIKLITNQK
ncbi:MAG: hypothetical protein ACK57D_15275 [Sphingobacteriales bacterium]|jgi:hypothetical protein